MEASIECLRSKKADEIMVMDLRQVSDVADYFILCTGGSDVHVRAIGDGLVEGLEEAGESVWHVEGYESGKWVLIDLVNVVIHVFQSATRQFYGLERMWGDFAIELEEEDLAIVKPGPGGTQRLLGSATAI